MKTRCTEVTNHDHQWEVYLRFVFFITSSGCLKSGAFLVSFWAGKHGRSVINTSQTCLIFFFVVCWSVMVHVRSPVWNTHLLSCCWKTATRKNQSWQEKKKKIVVMTSLLWMFAFCVSLPLCTVTFCVPVESHTHTYLSFVLCNSCSCDYDGFVVLGLTSLESVPQRTS